MYHRIVDEAAGRPSTARPSQLRKELEQLAKHGYVPITAREFATGKIDIPAGRHPVVLTFDDGHPSHFALDAQRQAREGHRGRHASSTSPGDTRASGPSPRSGSTATRSACERPERASSAPCGGWPSTASRWPTTPGRHPNLAACRRRRSREQIVRMRAAAEEARAPPLRDAGAAVRRDAAVKKIAPRSRHVGRHRLRLQGRLPGRGRAVASRRTSRSSTGGPSSGSRATAKRASAASGARNTGWSGWTSTPASATRPTATLNASPSRRSFGVISRPSGGSRSTPIERAAVGPRLVRPGLTARRMVSYADRCAVGSRAPQTERARARSRR